MSGSEYDGLVADVIAVVVIVAAIFLLREVVLWFFKSNRTTQLLRQTQHRLHRIESVLTTLVGDLPLPP